MAARHEADAPPEEFGRAVAQLRTARLPTEVSVEELPAPQRIAPFSTAIGAEVVVDSAEVATGRLVVLHDPAGNDAWEGRLRCVAYARAEIEPEMVTDALLSAVGWSWLTDALAHHDAPYVAPSGTVTRVASDSFGGMADEPGSAEIEIRASWTPLGDLGRHVEAWAELLCTAAGLPPVPRGVVAMPSRRGGSRAR